MADTFVSFMTYLPNQVEFKRIQGHDNYEAFIQWNKECFNDLLNDDYTWINGLCKRFTKGSINIIDNQSCSNFTASKVFFDKNKKITIS